LPPTPAITRRLLLLVVGAVLALAGCGGGGGDENVKALLNRAFKRPIGSADLRLDSNIAVNGLPSLNRPVRLQASGPYISKGSRAPSQFDLDLKVGVNGGGASFNTGALSTGKRAFVKFEDSFYELPQSQVESTNRALGSERRGSGALKNLGLNPRSWIKNAEHRGDDEIGGVQTDHVGGNLDVQRTVRDLNGFLQKAGSRLGGSGRVPRPLSDSDLSKISDVVKDPSFDVYVGKKDGIIRRLSARFELKVPDNDRSKVGGVKGGTLQFTLEFHNVGGNQHVEAPATARPISALTTQLGALGSGLGGAVTPGATGTPGAGGTSGGSGSGSAPGAGEFKRYGKCLDKTNPNDTRALQRCSDLLNPR
jgi:hypothetical protein